MCDKEDKCDLSKLTDYDIKINEIKRGEIYNGTVLVCIVYGLFAISILLASYFNERIRDIFFNEFIIFTIIFIIGSIIIISVLFYYINNYQPKRTKHINSYDTYSCPDYWKMVMLDDTEVAKNFDSNISPNYFKYKCVLNNDIFDKYGNYTTSFPNSNLNYNLTNNIYSTGTRKDGDSDTYELLKGDYYKAANDAKLASNIKINLGHLYKSINNDLIFPQANNLNYYAYNKPGDKLLDKNMSNIKNAIIESSLKMNNYLYDSKLSAYSNINTSSITDKFDPYITWNAKNKTQAQKTADYELTNLDSITGTKGNSGAIYYENYYVLKWYTGNNINYNYYKSLFDDTINKRDVYVYIGAGTSTEQKNIISNYIKIGFIKKEDNNIFFESIPKKKISSETNAFSALSGTSEFLISYYNKIPDFQNYMIQSYIATNTTTANNASEFKLTLGPIITFDNGLGRPPVITEANIKANTISIPVVCDAVYPAYLASIEDENAYGSDNTIRCSYAKLCGYSWSDMGCN